MPTGTCCPSQSHSREPFSLKMQGKQLWAGEKREDLRDARGGMGRIWWEDKKGESSGEDSNPGSLDPDLMDFTPGLETEDCGIR